EPVLAEEQKPSDGWHLASLMLRDDAQSVPCLGVQLPVRSKQLGSSSAVDRFRLQAGNGVLVERDSPVQAFQLFDLQCFRSSIGRADADEDSVFGSQPFQIVRAC